MSQPALDPYAWVRRVGTLASIPMILVGGPTLGFLVGRFLDRRFGWDPWGVMGGVLIGLIASIVETVRLIQQVQGTPNDDSKRTDA